MQPTVTCGHLLPTPELVHFQVLRRKLLPTQPACFDPLGAQVILVVLDIKPCPVKLSAKLTTSPLVPTILLMPHDFILATHFRAPKWCIYALDFQRVVRYEERETWELHSSRYLVVV
eukprot:comp15255_c1_seq1/m.12027 comp15255_c1_seq1/g.12027  ORF comp15255_c1_seq1/g.12027 comp15255_c1_seq1/m.12027 type:complete len:117 (+) comp15255_c1_seq1:875-1225(+)